MSNKIIKILKEGGIGVLATDTIYGLVGSALNERTVKIIYKLRKRNLKKPMIILLSSFNDLRLFNIKIDSHLKRTLSKIWPGKVSVILSCPYKKFEYLHRGTKNLAFRVPKNKNLTNLLEKTGPLVAPSANFEGMPPAKSIKEAKNYFDKNIDFYLNKGIIESLPSTLIQIKNKKIVILREGTEKIKGR